jgi:glycosyltransferase involved in cell wall biosynthesis
MSKTWRPIKNLGHHIDVISGPTYPDLDDDIKLHRLPSLDLYNPDDLFRRPSLEELKDPINLIGWIGVSTMGFPEPFTFGLRACRFLKTRLPRYDIIHDNQSLSYGIWKLSRRIPTVATIHHPITVDRDIAVQHAHNFWVKMKKLRWYSFVHMQTCVARQLKRSVTVSQCTKRDIADAFDLPAASIKIAPCGIDTDLFRPMPGIRKRPFRVITTSSSGDPLKGLAFLLRAVAEIKKTRSIELIAISPVKNNGYIEKLVKRLNIKKEVKFFSGIDSEELVRHYNKASVAVVPSLYEGFGLPAGEAMACGVAFISTDGGALPEIVGNAGIKVPKSDARALKEAMLFLFDNKAEAKRYGAAGLSRIEVNFTWQKTAEKTIDIYREVMDMFNAGKRLR